MPLTQINGEQIQQHTVTDEIFSPASIDGSVIKPNTIVNEHLVGGVDADKILIKDLSGKYSAKDLESVVAEVANNFSAVNTEMSNNQAAVSTQLTQLNDKITNDIGVAVAANKTDADNKISSLTTTVNNNKASLEGEIATVNSAIAANKTDADGKISALQTTVNDTISVAIAANKTDADKKIGDLQTAVNGQIATVNGTITANKTDADTKIANLQTALNTTISDAIADNKSDADGKIATLSGTVTANKTDADGKISALTGTVTANKTDADGKISALQTAVSTTNGTVTANKTDVDSKISALQSGKADLAGNANQDFTAKGVNVSGDIIPATTKTHSIGSPTNRFKTIYVDEAMLSVNTLYLGDTPVLGTSQDTVMVKADKDQSINIKTTGNGQTLLTSETGGVVMSTSGMNSDVKIQTTGSGSRTVISSASDTVMTSPNINLNGALNVTGGASIDGLTVRNNLTVQGVITNVEIQQVKVDNNMIELNKGDLGPGVTAGRAGIQIDRGTAPAYQLVFDENTDMFKIGMSASLETIATQEYVTANKYVHPATHAPSIIAQDTNNRFVTDAQIGVWTGKADNAVVTTSVNGLMSAADKAKLDGVAAGATNYVHPANHAPSIITQDANNRFVTDSEKTTWNGKASTAVATTSANGLMSSADKTKLDGVEPSANNYVHPATHAPSIIAQDASNRFVTDTQISAWNGKASTTVVTTSVNGLMSASDKTKLDGVAAGANNYVHPATHAPSIIAQDASNRFFTDTERTKLGNIKQNVCGNGNFAGLGASATITFGTAMANTNYTVSVMPTQAPNGDLGEVWVIKSTTGIAVYNSGAFTGTFDYTINY